MEEWKSVIGWEGFYEVSSEGRVRSLTRTIHIKNPQGVVRPRTYQGVLLGAHVSTNGYPVVALTRPGRKPVCRNVHGLVLEAFVGAAPAGMECCHGPAGKTVNAVANLKWDTRSANSLDRHRDGTIPDNRGEASANAKLTDDAARWVREMRGIYTQRQLGRILGVSHSAVGYVQRNTAWRNVSC